MCFFCWVAYGGLLVGLFVELVWGSLAASWPLRGMPPRAGASRPRAGWPGEVVVVRDMRSVWWRACLVKGGESDAFASSYQVSELPLCEWCSLECYVVPEFCYDPDSSEVSVEWAF